MNEIEKLYENAGIKDKCGYICSAKGIGCNECPNKNRKFTAEKQLLILQMFCRRYLEVSQHVEESGDLCFGIKATVGDYTVGFNKDFAECLADFVNCLWQDLTEDEKEQVREILNG